MSTSWWLRPDGTSSVTAKAAPAAEEDATGAASHNGGADKPAQRQESIVTQQPYWSGWNRHATEENGLIVGLSGYGTSGKDTVAGFMADYGFTRLAFADPLKAVALACDPIIDTYDPYEWSPVILSDVVKAIGWERVKRDYPDSRVFLQDLGVAVREHVDPDAWVNALFRQTSPGRRYVVTDVRFPNEAAAIKARGGIVIRVHRPGVKAVNGHASETALDDWDFDAHLFNDGDIDHTLRYRVRDFIIAEGLE